MRELMYVAIVSVCMSLLASVTLNVLLPVNECTAYKADMLPE